jgi:four helix bundle protein
MARGYRDLIVWQKSMDFAVCLYGIAKEFPKFELFGLVSQITRAAISVPANIAEGCSRKSYKEKVQFLHIAFGSLSEVETYIELAIRLDYISEEKYIDMTERKEEIRKMLYSLIIKFKNS